MTSEPESTPRRRPPTIDLKATEVETEQPVSAASSATPESPPDETTNAKAEPESTARAPGAFFRVTRLLPRSAGAYATGTLAGAAVTLVVLAGLWIAGVLPPPGRTAQAVAQASDAAKDISARLDRIDAVLSGQRPDAARIRQAAAAEAATKSLGDSLAALNRRVDDIAVAAKSALARADAAADAADAVKNEARHAGVERSELDALANRVAALDATVKTLSDTLARRPTSADDRPARATLAAEALRAAVERGTPYAAELAAAKASGIDMNALAPLELFAAAGISSAASLASELLALTPALVHASGGSPGESSFLGRLQSNAQKLVRVTPIDAPPGDDPAAVLARIEAAAAHADIDAALAGVARLPEAARVLAESWVKKAEAREKAVAASRRIAADALAALTRSASQ